MNLRQVLFVVSVALIALALLLLTVYLSIKPPEMHSTINTCATAYSEIVGNCIIK
jgi:hypothetical protein